MEYICENRFFKLKLFYIHFHPTTRKSPLKLNNSVRKQKKKSETKLERKFQNQVREMEVFSVWSDLVCSGLVWSALTMN